jgi:hypothetical protein
MCRFIIDTTTEFGFSTSEQVEIQRDYLFRQYDLFLMSPSRRLRSRRTESIDYICAWYCRGLYNPCYPLARTPGLGVRVKAFAMMSPAQLL